MDATTFQAIACLGSLGLAHGDILLDNEDQIKLVDLTMLSKLEKISTMVTYRT